MTALHFFAHGSYQKAVGISQHSGLSQTSVSNSLHEVVHVMVRYLGNAYIKLYIQTVYVICICINSTPLIKHHEFYLSKYRSENIFENRINQKQL
jgi:hypothetical protein